MNKKEMKSIQESIKSFEDVFGGVITISNNKGMWMANGSVNRVRVLVATGDDIFSLLSKLSNKINTKKKEVGK